jgi:hypothetical protein
VASEQHIERKLAAIIADIVGYSRLAGAPDHARAHWAMGLVFGFINGIQQSPNANGRWRWIETSPAHAVIGMHKPGPFRLAFETAGAVRQ